MSYDRSMRVTEANAEFEQLEDRERMGFLRALDAAPVDVTPWEEHFIETQLVRASREVQSSEVQSQTGRYSYSFTLDERGFIDELRREYAGKLNL